VKTINDRYTIIEELGESDNSIVYKAVDSLYDREVFVKFINRNSGKQFPIDLFKKEYLANRTIQHPLIRSLYSFEKAAIVDGVQVTDADWFISGEYCPGIFSGRSPDRTDIELLKHAVTFLHANNFYHGDLKKDNILISANGKVKLTDISPFFDTKFAQKNDVSKLNDLTGQSLCSVIPGIDDADIIAQHAAILKDHLSGSDILITHVVPDTDIQRLIQSESNIVFYSPMDIGNAQFAAEGLLPYCETAGYYVIRLECSQYHAHRLSAALLDYFNQFDFSRAIIREHGEEYVKINPNLCFTPSQVLSKPELELKKTIEFAAFFIETIIDIFPLCIYVPQFTDLDTASIELLTLLHDRIEAENFRLITGSNEMITVSNFETYEIASLEYEKFVTVMKYYNYFWELPETVQQQLFTMSNGEPIIISEGMHKLGADRGFELRGTCIVPEHPIEYYFDRMTMIRQIVHNFSHDERDIAALVSVAGDCFIDTVVAEIPDLQEILSRLCEKGIIVNMHNYYYTRMPLLKNRLPIKKDNRFVVLLCNIIQKHLSKHKHLLRHYAYVSLIIKDPDEVFSATYDVYQEFARVHAGSDFDFYTSVFSQFIPHENKLRMKNRFLLFWTLFREDIHAKFDKSYLNEKLEKYARSAEEKARYSSFVIEYMPISKNDLAKYYSYFENADWVSDETGQRMIIALLMKMRMMGLYQECIERFRIIIEPHIELLPFAVQLDILTSMFSTYLEMNDYNQAAPIAEKLRQIYEAHVADIPDNYIISVYNASAIAARHNNDYDRAIEYYHRSYQAAQKMKHYTNMSVVSNNIGVVWYYKNDYEKYRYFLEKSNEYAERSENARQYFLTLNNLLNFYDSACDFKRMHALILKGDARIVLLQEERLKANYYNWKSEYYFVMNDLHEVSEALHYSDRYHCEIKKEFETSYLYHGRKVITLVASLKQTEALDYIRSIENSLGRAASTALLYEWYIYMLVWLYYYDTGVVVRHVLKKIKQILKKNNDMLSEIGSNELLLWHYKIIPDITKKLALAVVKQRSSRLLYLTLLLQNSSPKDPNYHEYCMQLWSFLLDILEAVPDEDRQQFMESPYMLKPMSVLKKAKIDCMENDFSVILYRYATKEQRALKKRQELFYANADARSILSHEELLEQTMRDIMTLTNTDRVIYFSYSTSDGWIFTKEVADTFWYEKEEKVVDDILFKCLTAARKDEVQYYSADAPRANEITYAFVIPLIDISLSRKGAKSGTSFTNLFTIRGAFYADTKRLLALPNKDAVNHTYYLREYVNVSLYYNQLKEAAMTDTLTGLYKRDIWLDMTKDMFKYAKEHGKSIGIVMSDIDHFKAVNDVYGHKKGDMVLTDVANLFLRNIRQFDVAGRYGGEEFIIALSVNDEAEAIMVTERLRTSVEKNIAIEGKAVTVSFGMAVYPSDGTFINELIEKADKALYAAKESGRNRVVSWRSLGDIQAESLQEKKHSVITNPAREKEKIDLIIELHNNDYYRGSLEEIGKKLTSVCNRYVPILTVLLVLQTKSEITLSDRRFPIGTTEGFPEYITDTTQLMVSIETHGVTIAVYFEEQVGGITLTLEKTYYTFIGNIIIEKLIRHFLNE